MKKVSLVLPFSSMKVRVNKFTLLPGQIVKVSIQPALVKTFTFIRNRKLQSILRKSHMQDTYGLLPFSDGNFLTLSSANEIYSLQACVPLVFEHVLFGSMDIFHQVMSQYMFSISPSLLNIDKEILYTQYSFLNDKR